MINWSQVPLFLFILLMIHSGAAIMWWIFGKTEYDHHLLLMTIGYFAAAEAKIAKTEIN